MLLKILKEGKGHLPLRCLLAGTHGRIVRDDVRLQFTAQEAQEVQRCRPVQGCLAEVDQGVEGHQAGAQLQGLHMADHRVAKIQATRGARSAENDVAADRVQLQLPLRHVQDLQGHHPVCSAHTGVSCSIHRENANFQAQILNPFQTMQRPWYRAVC